MGHFIIITPEELNLNNVGYEVGVIKRLVSLSQSVIIHVRKKNVDLDAMRDYLSTLLNEVDASNLVVHYYAQLAEEHGIKGYHISYGDLIDLSREELKLIASKFLLSVSCHSFDELANVNENFSEECRYAFISPIFNSISKKGYCSNFNFDELRQFINGSKRDVKYIALGGVDGENIEQIKNIGFDGAALLGSIWSVDSDAAVENFKQIIKVWEREE